MLGVLLHVTTTFTLAVSSLGAREAPSRLILVLVLACALCMVSKLKPQL
jgi:hypothetical protein